MILDLMINGELKMTAEVDVENLTHGQWKRQVCKLLGVPFSKGLWRYNVVADKKYFDIIINKGRNTQWTEECISIIDQKAVCKGVIK